MSVRGLEKDIERWLGNQLKPRGFLYYKFVSPANPGVPDRIVVCPDGTAWFVELKTRRGSAGPAQLVHLAMLAAHGQRTALVKGWEDARKFCAMLLAEHAARGPIEPVWGRPLPLRGRGPESESGGKI